MVSFPPARVEKPLEAQQAAKTILWLSLELQEEQGEWLLQLGQCRNLSGCLVEAVLLLCKKHPPLAQGKKR